MAVKISASVGRGGKNNTTDVTAIQNLLNQNIGRLTPMAPVVVSGVIDDQTIYLIEEFQSRILLHSAPDGRVDPKGKTLAALNGESVPSSDKAMAGATGEPELTGLSLPAPAAKVLKEILKSAGIPKAKITSVSRTPAEQARVMYENCVSKGAQFNKDMYASAGDKVVDVYTANKDKPKATVIQLMLDKINEVGPTKVSKHISDTHYTFDVAPSSIASTKHAAFLTAINAHKAVSKVIPPPGDPAFHIEIPKDSPNL